MSVRERNQRVVRLKDELQCMLDMGVHAREALANELDGLVAQKRLAIDSDWIKKFKELATTYNNLTDAHVRLSKAERSLDNELTPEEERQAVVEYVKGLQPDERAPLLQELNRFHFKNNGRTRKWLIEDPTQERPSDE